MHVPLGVLSSDGVAEDCIDAVGLGLDLTRRGKQSELKKAGLPWTVSKSFAGSALLSPMTPYNKERFRLDELSFALEVLDPRHAHEQFASAFIDRGLFTVGEWH